MSVHIRLLIEHRYVGKIKKLHFITILKIIIHYPKIIITHAPMIRLLMQAVVTYLGGSKLWVCSKVALNSYFSIGTLAYQIKKKSNLNYTRLINALTGITSERCGAHLLGFAPCPHINVAAVTSRWRRVWDLIESGFESHNYCTRDRRF